MNIICTNAAIDRKGRIVPNGVRLCSEKPITLFIVKELNGCNIAFIMSETECEPSIPLDVLNEAGIDPDSALQFSCEDGRIIVETIDDDEFDRVDRPTDKNDDNMEE